MSRPTLVGIQSDQDSHFGGILGGLGGVWLPRVSSHNSVNLPFAGSSQQNVSIVVLIKRLCNECKTSREHKPPFSHTTQTFPLQPSVRGNSKKIPVGWKCANSKSCSGRRTREIAPATTTCGPTFANVINGEIKGDVLDKDWESYLSTMSKKNF